MTRERYESISLHDLREIAKTRGMRRISTLKKADLIDALLKKDEEDAVILRNERMQRKQMHGKRSESRPQQSHRTGIRRRESVHGIGGRDPSFRRTAGKESLCCRRQPDQNEKSGLPERTPGKRYL